MFIKSPNIFWKKKFQEKKFYPRSGHPTPLPYTPPYTHPTPVGCRVGCRAGARSRGWALFGPLRAAEFPRREIFFHPGTDLRITPNFCPGRNPFIPEPLLIIKNIENSQCKARIVPAVGQGLASSPVQLFLRKRLELRISMVGPVDSGTIFTDFDFRRCQARLANCNQIEKEKTFHLNFAGQKTHFGDFAKTEYVIEIVKKLLPGACI